MGRTTAHVLAGIAVALPLVGACSSQDEAEPDALAVAPEARRGAASPRSAERTPPRAPGNERVARPDDEPRSLDWGDREPREDGLTRFERRDPELADRPPDEDSRSRPKSDARAVSERSTARLFRSDAETPPVDRPAETEGLGDRGEESDPARRAAPFDAEDRRALVQLESSDPLIRAEAAARIEPEGAGLRALLVVLEEDPDPRVRVAAVLQLEDAESPAGIRGLVAALHDPDRSVVLEAIDVLEFTADERVIPSLFPLLEHSDREVRDAVAEAIDFLE